MLTAASSYFLVNVISLVPIDLLKSNLSKIKSIEKKLETSSISNYTFLSREKCLELNVK